MSGDLIKTSWMRPLTTAALASTLIALPQVIQAADITISTVLNGTAVTNGDSLIITPSGGYDFTGGAVLIDINTGTDSLTLQPANNTTAAPTPPFPASVSSIIESGIAGDSQSTAVVRFTGTADGGTLSVGAGSGITAQNTSNLNPGPDAVQVDASNVTILNDGLIWSEGSRTIFLPDGANHVVQNTGTIISTDAFGDAFEITNASGVITNSGTITTDQGSAFDFNTGNSVFTITNETGGVISTADGTGNAAFRTGGVSASNITVNNSGTIESQRWFAILGGIGANDNSNTFTVNNNLGGTILVKGADDGILIGSFTAFGQVNVNNAGSFTSDRDNLHVDANNDGTVANVDNSGTMISTSADNIDFGSVMTGSVTNSGTMQATGRNIFLRAGGVFTGNILNSGSMTASANNVELQGSLVGNFTNNGTISGDSITFLVGADPMTGNFTNTGTMSSTGNSVFSLDNNIQGDVLNSGTMTTANGITVNLDGGIITGTFTNSGTISQTGANIAFTTGTGNVDGGIINSGNIITDNPIAVTLQSSPSTNFTQLGGTITGDVILSNNQANTFTMSGGTITGNLSGGLQNDTFNISGGSILGSFNGAGGENTLNVNGDFTSVGPMINIDRFNVNNNSTFTVDGAIGTVSAVAGANFTINAGSSMVVNNLISDDGNSLSILNGGTVVLSDTGLLNMSSSSFQNNGVLSVSEGAIATMDSFTNLGTPSRYIFEISELPGNRFASINAANASDVTNDTFQVVVTGEGFISDGDVFPVLDNGASNITGNNTITVGQPVSQTLFFTNNITDPTKIQLNANRNAFQEVVDSKIAQSVASALDLIVNDPNLNPDIKTAISQIDVLQSKNEVTQALESLAPPVDGALIDVSQSMHNRAVDTVVSRVNESRTVYDLIGTFASGGDNYYGLGAWLKVYASRISQQEVAGIEGYTASLSAATVGADRLLSPYWRVGGAISYWLGDVEGRSFANHEMDIDSFQLTLYSSFDPGNAWYMDSFASIGLNRYKSSRDIAAGTLAITSSTTFKAWQYSARIQTGYNFKVGNKYRITPLARVRIGMLDVDPYTESGAGGLSLAVENDNALEIVGSAGIRFSSVNEFVEAKYVPEFRAMVHFDFLRDGPETIANFVPNGNAFFVTEGVKPDNITYNFGTSLTAYSADGLTFSINYDFDFKKQYMEHSGFLKVRYEW